jgi:tetratricopeptide (TPR) repeat protein
MADVIPLIPRHAQDRAFVLYLRACELDEDPVTLAAAESLYKEALALDPELAVAHTNLGALYHRRGEVERATAAFHKARAIDMDQAEAPYDLGVIYHDRAEPGRARGFFEIALHNAEAQKSPIVADVHYRLALSLDECGEVLAARPHWQAYLDMEPHGEWAREAREWLRMTAPGAPLGPASSGKQALVVLRGGKR